MNPNEISLKGLEGKGLCDMCGFIIDEYDHFCNGCRERVVTAIPLDYVKQFLADKLIELEKNKQLWTGMGDVVLWEDIIKTFKE